MPRTVTALAVAVMALLFGPGAPAATAQPVAAAQPLVAIAPVPGAVVRPFDPPQSRYGRGHRGVDLSVAPGEVVVAAMDGVVGFAGSVAGERWMTLGHADGLQTTYGGVIARVRVGDHVTIGQAIGHVRRGRRHLDWGVRLGDFYLDPAGLLIGWHAALVAVTES